MKKSEYSDANEDTDRFEEHLKTKYKEFCTKTHIDTESDNEVNDLILIIINYYYNNYYYYYYI
jgi:hypothetical protein